MGSLAGGGIVSLLGTLSHRDARTGTRQLLEAALQFGSLSHWRQAQSTELILEEGTRASECKEEGAGGGTSVNTCTS